MFGGATAFPPGQGTWKGKDGLLKTDDTVIVFAYFDPADVDAMAVQHLVAFLRRLGREGEQNEVGFVVGDERKEEARIIQ